MLDRVQASSATAGVAEPWDVIVIGGGATGLGAALDAATRGYRTLLLEQHDFAKGTSSRSTKLVHGGVRYLQQGNVSLVMEALKERGRLLANAPHLTRNQPFVVPVYDWWDGPFYGLGMKLYDLLAGKLGLGPSRLLSREETIARLPNVETKGLKNGVVYHDGQFDDARLALCLAASIAAHGGTVLNYAAVTGFRKTGGRITGVEMRDGETGRDYSLDGRVVINATGIFTDRLRHLDDPGEAPLLALSQGVHLVLDHRFLAGDSAIMVPKTADGRVLFAVPWHGRTVVGTTDIAIPEASLEPRATEAEIAFLLEHAALYLDQDPTRADIRSIFTGIRPLVRAAGDRGTAALSRDHTLLISDSNLVTITGGKWTTYRSMAEDVVDAAALVAGLPDRPALTKELRLDGWVESPVEAPGLLSLHGAHADRVRAVLAEQPGWDAPLHPDLPYFTGEVAHAARYEMARTVEDVLARRTRALLLDAAASIAAAPRVAAILAAELGRDSAWADAQVADFTTTAASHLP
jgi:glycerol-3-phosphate dehydrogenase